MSDTEVETGLFLALAEATVEPGAQGAPRIAATARKEADRRRMLSAFARAATLALFVASIPAAAALVAEQRAEESLNADLVWSDSLDPAAHVAVATLE